MDASMCISINARITHVHAGLQWTRQTKDVCRSLLSLPLLPTGCSLAPSSFLFNGFCPLGSSKPIMFRCYLIPIPTQACRTGPSWMQRFRSYGRWETPVAGSDSLGLTSTATWINDLSFHCSSSPPNTGVKYRCDHLHNTGILMNAIKIGSEGTLRKEGLAIIFSLLCLFCLHQSSRVGSGWWWGRREAPPLVDPQQHAPWRYVEHNSRRGTRGSSGHVLPAIMTRRLTQYLRGMYLISSHAIMKIFAWLGLFCISNIGPTAHLLY